MKRKIFVIWFLWSFIFPCSATTLYKVKLTSVNFDASASNIVFISTTTVPTIHGCQTDTNWNFVMVLITASDRVIYASLLSALTAGKSVTFNGTDDCNVFNGIETVKTVRVWSD